MYQSIVDISAKNLVLKNVGNAMYMHTDVQMRDAIENANMYNLRNTLRIFFDKLELTNNPAPVDLSAVSVEHIMPQAMPKAWLTDLNIDEETYQYNLHRLGNLTLAAKPDNSAIGAKLWEYKNAILKSTNHLKINEKLLQVEKWNVDEIDNRTKNLIERMIDLYPYPQISDDVIQREEIFLEYKEATAVRYFSLEDGSVEVDTGSTLAMRDDAANFQFVEDYRQDLLEDGYITDVDGKLQFVKPYIFYSSSKMSTALSTSASVIAHGSKNGWKYWRDKTGKVMDSNKKIKSLFGGTTEVEEEEE